MRAWYSCTLEKLAKADIEAVVGVLSTAAADRRLDLNPESTGSWRTTVSLLQAAAIEIMQAIPESNGWHLGLEYELPRRRKRVDAVVLASNVLLLIEMKTGASTFDRAAKWQAEQYALDIRDFHEGSTGLRVAPFVIATRAQESEPWSREEAKQVLPVQSVIPTELAARAIQTMQAVSDPGLPPIPWEAWEGSGYRPSPTIIEAAQQLYSNHDVRDISLAGSTNLEVTVEAVLELIDECRATNQRGIAFITGAPGAGKTLAGLQVVHDSRLTEDQETLGVFLSGNMPLVEVISTALAQSQRAEGRNRAEGQRSVSAAIQHAYLFRNEYAENIDRFPPEHLVLFDEAQRAWDVEQVSRWTKGLSTRSEPHILLDVMSRVPDWAVVIAMVGGGQEINRGEAGLGEWGRALLNGHESWLVRAAPEVLPGSSDRPGGRLFDEVPTAQLDIQHDERLHLTMNVRSPRAERLNQWVDAVIAIDPALALQNLPDPDEFPIALTRNLEAAKEWLRGKTEFDEGHHAGLLASSDARRLRAWGLDTNVLRQEKGWADWFLRPLGDVRSSNQLEVPATNFDCQGLELEWACVCWGNDLTLASGGTSWNTRQFRGTKWQQASAQNARYLLNSYRVLLTRARRGQVIWVPQPDGRDHTLESNLFDEVFDLLREMGAQVID